MSGANLHLRNLNRRLLAIVLLFAFAAKLLAAEGTMATREGLIGISEHLTQLPGGGGIDPVNKRVSSHFLYLT